jgi:hypothetical protein
MVPARYLAASHPGSAPLWRLWLLFFAYAAIVALVVQLVLLPHVLPGLHAGHGLLIGGDWISFHHQAVELADQVRVNGWSSWRLRPDDVSAPAGISAAIYALTVPEPWTTIPLYAGLHATAAIIVLSLVRLFLPDWRQAIWCVLPFLLYPSAMLVYTQIHKDAFAITGALCFLYGWVLVARKETWHGGFWLPAQAVLCILLGSTLAWLVRPYWVQMMQGVSVILVLLISGACILAGVRRERSRLRVLTPILTACLAVAILSPLTRGGYAAMPYQYLATQASSGAVPSTGAAATGPAGTVGLDAAAGVASQPIDPPVAPPESTAADAAGANETTGVVSAQRETTPSQVTGGSQSSQGRTSQAGGTTDVAGVPTRQLERTPEESLADSYYSQLGQPTLVIPSSLSWSTTPWLPRVLDDRLYTIATVREQARLGYGDVASAIDSDITLDSAGAVIAYLPRALLIVLLAPFPPDWFGRGSYESTTLMRRVAAGEMIGVYLALAILPCAMWYWWRRIEFWVILAFCTGMMLIYAIAIPTVGVLYRVRYGFLMTLVALAIAGGIVAWQSMCRIHPAERPLQRNVLKH